MKDGLKTSEIRARLKERYAPPAYALFEEVADGTGFHVSRHLDAMALSLWPSRGLTISGFEIKSSRSDWLKELRQPEKADAFAAYCDYFFLVVGDRKIVQAGELPENWGLLVPFGQKLKVEKEPVKNPSTILDRSLLMAIARKSHETASAKVEMERLRNLHANELSAQYNKGYENGKASASPGLYDRYKQLREQVDRFAEISGVRIHGDWDSKWPEEVGKAINTLRSGSAYEAKSLRRAAEQLEMIAKAFETSFEVPMSEAAKA